MFLKTLKIPTLVVLVLLGLTGAAAKLASSAAAARPADDQLQPAAELQALRGELQEAKQEIKQLKEALRQAQQSARQTRPRLYRGKPISYWIEQLSDGDPSYRKEAVTVLGVISQDDQSVIEPLLGALRDKDVTVGEEAASSLRHAGPLVVPRLTALLKEEGPIQALAAFALGYHRHDAKSAVPALMDVLKSRDRQARKAAAGTLTHIGPMANEAVPALIQALKQDLSMQGSYREITAASLVQVLGLEPAAADAIGGNVGRWPLFPDSREALRRLLRLVPCVAMTNSDRSHGDQVLKQLGFALSDWVCAEEVRVYKPSPAFWQAVAARRRIVPGAHWWHISAYADYDLQTACRLGLTTVFVTRPHARPGPADHQVADLGQVAALVEWDRG